MKNLTYKNPLKLGYHRIEIYHPVRNVPYPDASETIHGDGFQVSRHKLGQFPSDARLFVDGLCEGKLINLFTE